MHPFNPLGDLVKKEFCTNEVRFALLPGLVLVYSFPHAVDDPEQMTPIQEWRAVPSVLGLVILQSY